MLSPLVEKLLQCLEWSVSVVIHCLKCAAGPGPLSEDAVGSRGSDQRFGFVIPIILGRNEILLHRTEDPPNVV